VSVELYNIVHKTVIATITHKQFIESELRHALLKSDNGKARLKLLARNIVNQIKSEKSWVYIDQYRLKALVSDLTEFFLYAFKRQAMEKSISDLAKSQIIKEHTKFDFLDENGNGTDPETGIKIADKVISDGSTSS
jgi:hypothetical protein